MGKINKIQVDALKYLNLSNKIDELNQIKSIFQQNQINDLIHDRPKGINPSQNTIELNELDYKANFHCLLHF